MPVFKIDNFEGRLKTAKNAVALQPNEAIVCEQVDYFDDAGALKQGGGFATTSYASGSSITGLDRFYESSGIRELTVVDEATATLYPSSGSNGTLAVGGTARKRFAGAYDLRFAVGQDIVPKTIKGLGNQSSIRRMGFQEPYSNDGTAISTYTAAALPADSTPAWTKVGTPTESVASSILTTAQGSSGIAYYTINTSAVSGTSFIRISANVSITSGGINKTATRAPAFMFIDDGAKICVLAIYDDALSVGYFSGAPSNSNFVELASVYPLKNNDGYHIYSLWKDGNNSVKVYRDGELALYIAYSKFGATQSGKNVGFGLSTTSAITVKWKYDTANNFLGTLEGGGASAAVLARYSQPMTAAVGAAGVLTGTYSYKVSFIFEGNTSRESTAKPSNGIATVILASQQGSLSNIPTGTSNGISGVTARNIYRTRAVDATRWYYVATINDDTTTTYTDNTADASLELREAPNNNGTSPPTQYIAIWRDRCFTARSRLGQSYLYYSANAGDEVSDSSLNTEVHGANVEIFPDTFFMRVGDNNTPITGLAVFLDMLIVMKDDKIYTVTGYTPSNFRLRPVESAYGCCSGDSVAVSDYMFFVSRNKSAGIYRFDGATVRCISEDINPTIWDDVTTNRMQNAVGITYRGLYIVSIETSADTPSSKNNRLFIYEWKTNSWSINKNVGATHFTAFGGVDDTGALYFAHSNTGGIYQLFSGNTLAGTGISTKWRTGWLRPIVQGFNGRLQMKTITFLVLATSNGTLTVDRYYDFQSSAQRSNATAVLTSGYSKNADTVIGDSRGVRKWEVVCNASEEQFDYFSLALTITGASSGFTLYSIIFDFDLIKE